jgi:hypothetical protein
MKNVALVLAGVVLGGLAAVTLVPRVLAEGHHPAAPPKWQQFCESAASVAEASSLAGARGAEGWELVGYGNGALCFKRTAPPRSPNGDVAWPGY